MQFLIHGKDFYVWIGMKSCFVTVTRFWLTKFVCLDLKACMSIYIDELRLSLKLLLPTKKKKLTQKLHP